MTAPHPDVVNWNEIDGTPGNPDYTTGPPGPTGPAGPQGPIGPPGTNGSEGIQGDQGIPGAGWKVQQTSPVNGANTGDPLGTIWYNSATGQFWTLTSTTPYTWRLDGTVVGAQGNTGPAGPQGSQGPPGATGNTGPTGPQGVIGPPGPQGIQGTVGPQGAQGPQGNTGPAGGAGAQGPVGPSSSVHEEFMPGNGATTVTLSQTPQWILMVARAGVVQSQTDGNYSLAGAVITFTDPLNGSERIIVDYASTGYTPVPPISGAGIADGSITSLQIQDGAIATADLANQSVTNIKLGTDTARLNLLTNGGFEIWQRGNGPFTSATTADRWDMYFDGGDTMSVAMDAGVVDRNSTRSAKVVYTRSTGVNAAVYQVLRTTECNLRQLSVTWSVRVQATVANAVRASLTFDGTGGTTSLSAFHTGGGTWQTLSVTVTVPGDATYLQPKIQFLASCTAYVDNAMLVVGSVPADYAPLHPADDLARCLRYYEVIGQTQSSFNTQGYNSAGAGDAQWIPFKANKAVASTITKIGTWQVINCAQPIALAPSGLDGFTLGTTVTALGGYFFSNNVVGGCIISEANP